MNFGNPKTGVKRKNDESNDGPRKKAPAEASSQHRPNDVQEQIQRDLNAIDEANAESHRLEVNIRAMDIYQKAILQCNKVYAEIYRLDVHKVVWSNFTYDLSYLTEDRKNKDDGEEARKSLQFTLSGLEIKDGGASDQWVWEAFKVERWFDITKVLNSSTYIFPGPELRQNLSGLLRTCVSGNPTRFMVAKLKAEALSRRDTLQKNLEELIQCAHKGDYGYYKRFCRLKEIFERLQSEYLRLLRDHPDLEDDILKIIQRLQTIWAGHGEGYGPQRLHSKVMEMFDICNSLMKFMGSDLPFRLGQPVDPVLQVKEEDDS